MEAHIIPHKSCVQPTYSHLIMWAHAAGYGTPAGCPTCTLIGRSGRDPRHAVAQAPQCVAEPSEHSKHPPLATCHVACCCAACCALLDWQLGIQPALEVEASSMSYDGPSSTLCSRAKRAHESSTATYLPYGKKGGSAFQ